MVKRFQRMLLNMRVRTSIIATLVFFLTMLFLGAGLGLVSLNDSGQLMSQVRTHAAMTQYLDSTIDHLRKARIQLGEGVKAYLNYDNDVLIRATDPHSDILIVGDGSTVADNAIAQAKDSLAYAKKDLEQFERISKALFNENGKSGALYRLTRSVINAYDSYTKNALEPMLDALIERNLVAYDTALVGSGGYLLDDLEHASQQLKNESQELIEQTQRSDAAHYRLVVWLVITGMAFSMLASFLVYRFLVSVVINPLSKAVEHLDVVAKGDLTQPIVAHTSNEIGRLFEGLSHMQKSLTTMVQSVRDESANIATESNQIYQGNSDLSERTSGQAAALQQTAAAMEEIASTVNQNTDNAKRADEASKSAFKQASHGGQVVEKVSQMMQSVATQSNQIADIVNVIDGIAFQTNILALNAAVEAARAGESGRGFAVVASEVRALAQRSANASGEIKALIEASVGQINDGAAQAQAAQQVIDDVVRSVNEVTAIMSEIALASSEQQIGINQINQALNQMDGVVLQNSRLVVQASENAKRLNEQAARLSSAVSAFRVNHQVKGAKNV